MRFNRRTLFHACLVVPLLPGYAAAAGFTKFTQAGFQQAQAAGRSILVVINAPWCPTCKVQDPIIAKLVGEAKYKNVLVLEVDFDSEKDILRAMKASKQSTLIGFKGTKETGRSVGDTSPLGIEDLIEGTL
ncbi:MAG TPA: thioredoxin family protein [Beijerinckiaceae bacterium]|nr:thioredoxin family protein [Beijerinckiaceae bacterium]